MKNVIVLFCMVIFTFISCTKHRSPAPITGAYEDETATYNVQFTQTAAIIQTATQLVLNASSTAQAIQTATVNAVLSSTNTPTHSNTATNTYTPAITNTFTNTDTRTQTPTNTLSYTSTWTYTNTETFTITQTFSNTPTYTNTSTPTISPTPTNTVQTFEKYYGLAEDETAFSIKQTTDGGYIVCGFSNSFSNDHGYVVKLNSAGNQDWIKDYVLNTYAGFNDVIQTSDTGYLFVGYTGTSTRCNLYLLKTDSSGVEQWHQEYKYGSNLWNSGSSIEETADGSYVLAGKTSVTVGAISDECLFKVDSTGNTIWASVFSGTYNDYAYSVKSVPGNGYIIAGERDISGANEYTHRATLIKFDNSGNLEWQKDYGDAASTEDDEARSVLVCPDGGYLLVGTTMSYTISQSVLLVKTDSAGNQQWYKTFGATSGDEGYSISATSDGGYILAGYTNYNGGASADAYLLKIDSLGNQLWIKPFGGTGIMDCAHSVKQTLDGGYVFAGYTESYGAGLRDFYIVKTDSQGNK